MFDHEAAERKAEEQRQRQWDLEDDLWGDAYTGGCWLKGWRLVFFCRKLTTWAGAVGWLLWPTKKIQCNQFCAERSTFSLGNLGLIAVRLKAPGDRESCKCKAQHLKKSCRTFSSRVLGKDGNDLLFAGGGTYEKPQAREEEDLKLPSDTEILGWGALTGPRPLLGSRVPYFPWPGEKQKCSSACTYLQPTASHA